MLAPMINPYDAHITKEETKRTWEKWLPRRKMMYSLTRRFSKLLNFFYPAGKALDFELTC